MNLIKVVEEHRVVWFRSERDQARSKYYMHADKYAPTYFCRPTVEQRAECEAEVARMHAAYMEPGSRVRGS